MLVSDDNFLFFIFSSLAFVVALIGALLKSCGINKNQEIIFIFSVIFVNISVLLISKNTSDNAKYLNEILGYWYADDREIGFAMLGDMMRAMKIDPWFLIQLLRIIIVSLKIFLLQKITKGYNLMLVIYIPFVFMYNDFITLRSGIAMLFVYSSFYFVYVRGQALIGYFFLACSILFHYAFIVLFFVYPFAKKTYYRLMIRGDFRNNLVFVIYVVIGLFFVLNYESVFEYLNFTSKVNMWLYYQEHGYESHLSYIRPLHVYIFLVFFFYLYVLYKVGEIDEVRGVSVMSMLFGPLIFWTVFGFSGIIASRVYNVISVFYPILSRSTHGVLSVLILLLGFGQYLSLYINGHFLR